MTEREWVETYLALLADANAADFDGWQALLDYGASTEDAALVSLFVPMAFAYERLTALGVDMPLTFEVESTEGERVRARLFDQPLFLAARQAALQHSALTASQQELVTRMAAQSAEWDATHRLLGPDRRYGDLRLTEARLVGVPLHRLRLPRVPEVLPEPSGPDSGTESSASAREQWMRALGWVIVLGLILVAIATPQARNHGGKILIALLQSVCILAFVVNGAIHLAPAAARSRFLKVAMFFLSLTGLAGSVWLVARASLNPDAPVLGVSLPGSTRDRDASSPDRPER